VTADPNALMIALGKVWQPVALVCPKTAVAPIERVKLLPPNPPQPQDQVRRGWPAKQAGIIAARSTRSRVALLLAWKHGQRRPILPPTQAVSLSRLFLLLSAQKKTAPVQMRCLTAFVY
jgi:hypothetical protein